MKAQNLTEYKLMLVDDEAWVIEQLTRILQHFNEKQYSVTICGTAGNGQEALLLMERLKPDIIFMDIRMPQMDGIQFLETIAPLSHKPEVIFLSGYNKFEYAQATLNRGAAGYVLKPLIPNDIYQILDKAVRTLEERKKIAPWHYLDSYPQREASQSAPILSRQLEAALNKTDYNALCGILENLKKEFPDNAPINRHTYYNAYRYVIFLFDIMESYQITAIQGEEPLDYYAAIDSAQTNTQIFSILRQLFLKSMAEKKSAGTQEESSSLLADSIKKYINQHYMEDISLDFLSSIFHFHPVYLSSIFKKYHRQSFSSYLSEVRIEKAKELLKQGVRTSDVAVAVGYQSSKYFSDAFTRKVGLSPREYRKSTGFSPPTE